MVSAARQEEVRTARQATVQLVVEELLSNEAIALLTERLEAHSAEEGMPFQVEFLEDPKDWAEAMAGDNAEDFRARDMDELKSLIEMGVF